MHPRKQPPAIQIDTLTARSNRTALFEKNRRISTGVYARAKPLSTRITIAMKTQHFRNGSIVSLNSSGEALKMSIDKNKIKTQDELNEPAPMDKAEQRAEAEMKKLEDEAKKEVAEGLKQQSTDYTDNSA